MIRLSIGTEGVLGLRKLKTNAPPTTAYMMIGSKCSNKCLFCPQSQNSMSSQNLLSRVAWNEVQGSVWTEVKNAFGKQKIKRACLQVISQPGILNTILKEVKKARAITDVPICVSGGVSKVSDAEKLIEMGADRISIALDAATPEIYRRVKGLDFIKRLALLKECVNRFPGNIGTHLISGLGETEEEMIDMMQSLYDGGINIALFAFTPVKGTPMGDVQQPPIDSYRRIQVIHHLIKNKILRKEEVVFIKGKIASVPISSERMREILMDGVAFQTTGCDGCNRPYYNEKPGSTIYNYARKMSVEEIEKAIGQTELIVIDN
jgi:biotin synthase